ncbi:MAG: hypothetical protein SWE60_07545, partial [Thermodesulfobacteriota bacterium]|nr:hypothetical protein [Thermodesulfobacteriota bacterium]
MDWAVAQGFETTFIMNPGSARRSEQQRFYQEVDPLKKERRSSMASSFTSEDHGRVLAQFQSLSKALIDASSIIYMHKAGFFEELARTVKLCAPQEVVREAGFGSLPISVVPCHGGAGSNDHILIASALA